jgi:hypothetical protein
MADDDAVMQDITLAYGALTKDNVTANANTYQNQNNRNRQASSCIIAFINNSVTPDLYQELHQLKDEFTVTVQVNNADEQRQDGVLMLYALIGIVAVETRATVSRLLRSLNTLDKLMEDCNSDIKLFNKRVNDILVGLRARKATIPDIVNNLFIGYTNCADSKFVTYIEKKEEEYEDRTLAELSAPQLMQIALDKYKVSVSKGKWLQHTKQELQFLAMESRIDDTTKKLVPNQTTTTTTKTKKKGAGGGRPNEGKWAWKSVVKPGNENKEKTVEGKIYVHCPYHGDTKWVLKVNRDGVTHKTGCTKDP